MVRRNVSRFQALIAMAILPMRDQEFRSSLMIRKFVAAAVIGLASMTATANAADMFELGILDCKIDGGVGYLITSNKGLACSFKSSNGRATEYYSGVVSKLGVDLGKTHQGNLVWAVLAANRNYDSGRIAGKYFGVNAEASVITGGGANLLLGGFERSSALQPLSVQAQTGLNLAVAVQSLELVHSLK
jgi:small neutral amino acid transporter SnatA (MarC family)